MGKLEKVGLDPETERIGAEIVDAAYTVQKIMGPSLLESIYESCLSKELEKRNILFERQKLIPVYYGSDLLEEKLRIDLLVSGKVVVEVKSVEELIPIHEAQLTTYLRLAGCELGFLVNFNTKYFKDGIQRIVLSQK